MRRARITIDATMLAAAIRIDAQGKGDVRRVVFGNNALDSLTRDNGLRPPSLVPRRRLPAVVEDFAHSVLEAALGIKRRASAFVGRAVVSNDGFERHTVYNNSIRCRVGQLVDD